ncbi:hypothetical protein WJX77_000927 [Trebouxia sp. C0004]
MGRGRAGDLEPGTAAVPLPSIPLCNCQIKFAVLLKVSMLRGLVGRAQSGDMAVADTMRTNFQWPALQPFKQQYAWASTDSSELFWGCLWQTEDHI